MTLIVDKRRLPKGSSVNSRQKFIERNKKVLKNRVKDVIEKSSIKDFSKGGAKKITIKNDDLDIPNFDFNYETGKKEKILIGNKKYHKGDLLARPSGGRGRSKGGPGDKGEDDFEFMMTNEEFMNLFFEDLELPDMIKKNFLGASWVVKHAGFSRYGGPSSLNIKRTMLNAMGRRIALKRRREQENAEKEKKGLIQSEADKVKQQKIQYIEDLDLRYNFKDKVEEPTTKAVMFCLMDVSGSVSEKQKDISKRFFILLYLFLKKNYDVIDVVFVRHTDTAEEVDEKTFFYDKSNGGTMVSAGYEKIHEIIKQRFDIEKWNIYIAQATDGDNWDDDMAPMEQVLTTKLLPICQYFSYIDVRGAERYYLGTESLMFQTMQRLMVSHKNLVARCITSYDQIFSVFKSLFSKKAGVK